MQNLNPYNQKLFQLEFEQTSTFKRLKQKYDKIYFDKFFESRMNDVFTIRQVHAESRISAVSWYYLNYLDCSKQIVDLGCGMNFFKPYFPNLHGVGAEDISSGFFADEHDFVDDDFYLGHVNTYDAVFSINALHFHPLEDLRNICIKFSNMLKSSGRGFLSLNAQRMIERSKIFNEDHPTEQIDNWIRSQFQDFPNKILVFDIDLSVPNAWADGNIRIVFEK